jgi:hypothetical protein
MRIRFGWRTLCAIVGLLNLTNVAAAQQRAWMQSTQAPVAATAAPAPMQAPPPAATPQKSWGSMLSLPKLRGNGAATTASIPNAPYAAMPQAAAPRQAAAPPYAAGQRPPSMHTTVPAWYAAASAGNAANRAVAAPSFAPQANPQAAGFSPNVAAAPAPHYPLPAAPPPQQAAMIPTAAAPGVAMQAGAAPGGYVTPAAATMPYRSAASVPANRSPYAAAYVAQQPGYSLPLPTGVPAGVPTLAPQPDALSSGIVPGGSSMVDGGEYGGAIPPGAAGPYGQLPPGGPPAVGYGPPPTGFPNAAPNGPPPGYGPAPYGAPGSYGPPSPYTAGVGPAAAGCETCDPESYADPGYFDPGVKSCGPWFASVAAMMLTRDVPNNVGYSYYQADPATSVLQSESVGKNVWAQGLEGRIGRMIGQRWALEGVWWATNTLNDMQQVQSSNSTLNARLNFQDLFFQGVPQSDIFDNSPEHRLYRYNDFQNIEVNLMQQALAVDPGNRFGLTSFTGARYFTFDETLGFWAVQAGSTFGAADPTTQSNYIVREYNQLIGWQIGTRGHVNVGDRLRLFAMPRFGLFANRITQYQHVCMIIDNTSHKTDVTLLGQLDVGAAYQVLPCCSVFASYRAMGFSGMATADDNVARTFSSIPDMASINSSGSLILHGWTAGMQFQY